MGGSPPPVLGPGEMLGVETGIGGMWVKGPSPESGQTQWLGAGRAVPGYSCAGEMHCRRKGGRAGNVLCGHSNENIIPDV